jgi:preprotein translocase subunit SecY
VPSHVDPTEENNESHIEYTIREVRALKRSRNVFIWVGFAIVLIALGSYIPLFAVFPATRDVPWANYLLFLIGGALLTIGVRRAFRDPARYRGRISGSILSGLSVVLFAFFVAFVTYFSRQIPVAGTALGVGQKAPAFALLDTAGKQVSSADLLKNHRGLVLIFYRGYW